MTGKHVDQRVRRILEAEGIKYEIDGDGDFKVLFALDNGRSQVGFINSNTETFIGVEVREVWSVGLMGEGQLSAEVANSLLSRNHTYKLGGWEIVQRQGEVIAIFKICISADAPPTELLGCLIMSLKIADAVEKEYLGSDKL